MKAHMWEPDPGFIFTGVNPGLLHHLSLMYYCQLHMCICNVLKLQLTENLLLNYFLRKKVGQASPRSPGPPEPGMPQSITQ